MNHTCTCSACGKTFEGKHDYCPYCNAPLWDWDDLDD